MSETFIKAFACYSIDVYASAPLQSSTDRYLKLKKASIHQTHEPCVHPAIQPWPAIHVLTHIQPVHITTAVIQRRFLHQKPKMLIFPVTKENLRVSRFPLRTSANFISHYCTESLPLSIWAEEKCLLKSLSPKWSIWNRNVCFSELKSHLPSVWLLDLHRHVRQVEDRDRRSHKKGTTTLHLSNSYPPNGHSTCQSSSPLSAVLRRGAKPDLKHKNMWQRTYSMSKKRQKIMTWVLTDRWRGGGDA